MGKWTNDAVMDAGLNVVKTAASAVMHVCTTLDATPTRAEVLAASLANVAMATGDYTLADGTVSGRKFTTAAKNAVAVTATGTAVNVAIVDATQALDVTDCTSQALTSGNTVNIPAWSHEIADPT
jgi:hypothetical protein